MIYSRINSIGLTEQTKGRILSKQSELSAQLMPGQQGSGEWPSIPVNPGPHVESAHSEASSPIEKTLRGN